METPTPELLRKAKAETIAKKFSDDESPVKEHIKKYGARNRQINRLLGKKTQQSRFHLLMEPLQDINEMISIPAYAKFNGFVENQNRFYDSLTEEEKLSVIAKLNDTYMMVAELAYRLDEAATGLFEED